MQIIGTFLIFDALSGALASALPNPPAEAKLNVIPELKQVSVSTEWGLSGGTYQLIGRATQLDDSWHRKTSSSRDIRLWTARGEASDLDKRGLFDIAWAATKLFINPLSYTSYLNLAGLACTISDLITDAIPKGVQYACAAATFVSSFTTVWSGRSSVQAAYSAWQSEQSNLITLAELPFATFYGDVVDNIGMVKQKGHSSEAVRHPAIAAFATVAHSNLHRGGKVLHNVDNNHEVVSFAHVLAANETHPAHVQWSHHGYLLEDPVYLHPVGGKSRSAGLVARRSFTDDSNGASSKLSARQGDGNCDGRSNENQEFVGDDQGICDSGSQSNNGWTDMYFGMDFYGSEGQWEEFDSDEGGEYISSNGLGNVAESITNDMGNNNWWQACLCDQESGNYAWTGGLQLTQNGGFNGYNNCYQGVCGPNT